MGYFPVRYDSRVVIYSCKLFIRLAIGLVVLGRDSCSEGPGFESQYRKQDNGLFFVKIVMFFGKTYIN